MNEFIELCLSENTLDALEKKGLTTPTPIQAATIPLLLNGENDIVGQAQTGTGKTAAFGLPIVERVKASGGRVQALVLTPTRELALQVADEIHSLRGTKRINILPVYGGQSIVHQLRALSRGVDVVVGTPGRVLDHISRGSLDLAGLSYFILDEADEMCNMGFIDDVREIASHTGAHRRTLLFSATMPPEVMRIAREFMGEFETVRIAPPKNEDQGNTHVFYEIAESDRFEALCRVIDAAPDFYGLLFCRTKADTAEVAERLAGRGYAAECIHGDLSQSQREDILSRFRRRRVTVLVATDVAARGIDVADLTHVVNYALPQSPETYVHRTGRTGRAGKQGVAVTLIAPYEFRKLAYMARTTGIFVKKQRLPRIQDVIFTKKQRIAGEIEAILEREDFETCLPMARELLSEQDAEQVVAALLKHGFGDELSREGYREINDAPKPGSTAQGRVRLRVAMGRGHGMHPRKLVDFICDRARIPAFKVQNVKIMPKFSTFTVPSGLAGVVTRALNKGGGGPLVGSA